MITLLGARTCATMLVLVPPRGGRGGSGAAGAGRRWPCSRPDRVHRALIAWSVQPDDSWQATNLTLAYLGRVHRRCGAGTAGAGPMASAGGGDRGDERDPECLRAAGEGVPGLARGGDTSGRLQAPLGYWNATGVMAALGLAPCLWAWARARSRSLRALAVPAVAILIAVVVLSYSRSAVLVAVLSAGGWAAFVPRRLHAAALLALSAAGAAVIAAWALVAPGADQRRGSLAARPRRSHVRGSPRGHPRGAGRRRLRGRGRHRPGGRARADPPGRGPRCWWGWRCCRSPGWRRWRRPHAG